MLSKTAFSLMLLSAGIAVSLLTIPGAATAQSACVARSDIFLNPFNSDSAHHRPIGTGARYASDSHATTRDWLKASGLAVNPGTTFWGGFAVSGSAGDPARRVNVDPFAAQLGQSNRTFGLPVTVRMPNEAAQRPVRRSATGVSDSQTQVYDSTTGKLHEFYRFDWNNGNPIAWGHRSLDMRGLGHGTRPGQRVGPAAGGTSMLFGLLRGAQINNPGQPIAHALAASLPHSGANASLGQGLILPATGRDWHSATNAGSIPYGGLMALPPNVNIKNLGLSEAGERLAAAIQRYGIYVVDGTNSNQGAIRADQHIDPRIRNQLIADIRKIYPHMRMVLNSEWRPGQSAVGGGQPIAPNCAFNAGTTSVAPLPSDVSTGQVSTGTSSSPTSNNQTTSAGGSLQWPATQNAQNYYLEIREGSSRGSRVFGGMVRPQAAGCASGQGTCSSAVPPLPGGEQYVWNVRAVVNGNAQSPTAWQSIASSGSSGPSFTEQNSPNSSSSGDTASNNTANDNTAGNNTANDNTASNNQTTSAGGSLQWPATQNAQNYYLEIREGSSRGSRVFGGMVRPQAAGCASGQGTCSSAVPPLPGGEQYVWNVRAVVNGKVQSPTAWQSIASSGSSGPSFTEQNSPPSVPQTGSVSVAPTSTSDSPLRWAATPRASNYYLEIRQGSSRGSRVFGGMVRPQAAGCASGQGTCARDLPPLAADKPHVWNVRAVVDGTAQSPTRWEPVN